VSIYNDSLTPQCVDQELKKLVVAFPAVDPGFINVLSERLVANGFTNRRLKDAIGYVIDNFKYQKPNIADIISFDRKIKLYTHGEAYRLIVSGEVSGFEEFEIIESNGDKFRIKKSDKINFGYSG